MRHPDYVKRKLISLKAQIAQIAAGDFPYKDPRSALDRLRRALEEREQLLQDAVSLGHPKLIDAACKEINSALVNYLPLLGFILRATNIRNSFEIYDPIIRIAEKLLGRRLDLILSSERRFSPFVFPLVIDELEDYVLLGLPASEAGNALIIPSAGHELGHSVWRHCGIRDDLKEPINRNLMSCYVDESEAFEKLFGFRFSETELLGQTHSLENFSTASLLTSRQCEEIFCDLLGVRLFGEAFVHAFEYLLAPSLGGSRSAIYPAMKDRIEYMIAAVRAYGYELEQDHEANYDEDKDDSEEREDFALKMADLASKKMHPEMLALAEDFCTKRSINRLDAKEISKIEEGLRRFVPSNDICQLGEVIAAGWKIFNHLEGFAPGTKEIN